MAKTQQGTADAIEMLHGDHEKVKELFTQCERGGDINAAVTQLFNELEIHSKLEEELFYPALEEQGGGSEIGALGEDEESEDIEDSVAVALSEHETIRELIKEMKRMRPDSPEFRESLSQLKDAVLDHVAAEEDVLFPVARLQLDVEEMGQKMQQRRAELASAMSQG